MPQTTIQPPKTNSLSWQKKDRQFPQPHYGAKRITSSLVIKIILVFAGMAGVVAIFTFFTIASLNQGKDSNREALDREAISATFERLRLAAFQERLSVLKTLYSGELDPNLATYQENFNQEALDLISRGVQVASITGTHSKLKQIYDRAVENRGKDRTEEAQALWKAGENQATALTKLLDQNILDSANRAREASVQSDQIHASGPGLIFWLAFLAFIFMGFLIFYLFASVITPLGLLNANLNRLLWQQTEHLTDRLNLLQTEINFSAENLVTVRHDLKSPFSTIKNLAEVCTIIQPDLDPEVKASLEDIIKVADTSVTSMIEVLNRREQTLDLQPVQLNPLLEKVIQLVDLRGYDTRLEIEAKEWPLDAGLMEHALLNLLSNARKFSKHKITAGVRIPKTGEPEDGREEIEFWVWNDGAFIPQAEMGEIFQAGKQTSEGKRIGGHGLGLAIVKSIAQQHQGRVSAESGPLLGTTFHIFIPKLSLISPES